MGGMVVIDIIILRNINKAELFSYHKNGNRTNPIFRPPKIIIKIIKMKKIMIILILLVIFPKIMIKILYMIKIMIMLPLLVIFPGSLLLNRAWPPT